MHTDLKALAKSLAPLGLMNKRIADMDKKEILTVAHFCALYSAAQCITCAAWQKIEGRPWWEGMCARDGHDVSRNSFCTFERDETPF